MENKEKKQYTKVQIAGFVLIAVLVAAYIAVAILDVFNIIPNLQWVAHLLGGIAWLIIGVMSLGKNKWQPALDFLLAASFTALAILEMVELFA